MFGYSQQLQRKLLLRWEEVFEMEKKGKSYETI